MTIETAVPVIADDLFVMEPTTYSRIHILAPAPVATFDGQTYPSLQINDRPGFNTLGDARVTLTGTPEQRAEFVAQLRAVADAIEAWTEDAES